MTIPRLDILLRTALPMVYDDSITAVELMGKVIAQINTLTDELNAFMSQDLQAYVEAKLTLWTSDGTLETLLDETFMPRLTAAESVLAASAQYATPTGTADDTSYLQDLIDDNAQVILKAGTYLIDAVTKLVIPSNKTIIFEEGAVLQAIANNADSYTVISMSAVSNIEIRNPKIIGDRVGHTGVTGEYGHGLAVLSCDNIRVINPDVSYCWGDGIYINDSTNVKMNNVVVDNNRRNGFTLVSGENIMIDGILASNTNGTAPEAGIDIEPNLAGDPLKNIVFRNVKTVDNVYFGLMMVFQAIVAEAHDISILIDGHEDEGSAAGLCVSGFRATAQMTGSIMINNPSYRNSKSSAMMLYDYYANLTPPLIIKNPVIINPNTANNSTTYPQNCSGISVNRESTYAGTLKMGNITIINPTILDTRAVKLMKYGVYFHDGKSVGCDKIKIISPLEISGEVSHKILEATNVTTGIRIEDQLDTLLRVSDEQYNTIHNEAVRKFINTGATVLSQVNLYDDSWFDIPITFINVTEDGMIIIPSATCAILPLSAVAGKYITTTEIGARVTIRRLSATAFLVEDLQGTWTVQS